MMLCGFCVNNMISLPFIASYYLYTIVTRRENSLDNPISVHHLVEKKNIGENNMVNIV